MVTERILKQKKTNNGKYSEYGKVFENGSKKPIKSLEDQSIRGMDKGKMKAEKCHMDKMKAETCLRGNARQSEG